MLKNLSFYRIFLGLNLLLLASVPAEAQTQPTLTAGTQNLLSQPQIQNFPADFKNIGIKKQDTRFLNPGNVSSPEITQPQPQPLLTNNVPSGLELSNCHSPSTPRQILEAQGWKRNPDGRTVRFVSDCR